MPTFEIKTTREFFITAAERHRQAQGKLPTQGFVAGLLLIPIVAFALYLYFRGETQGAAIVALASIVVTFTFARRASGRVRNLRFVDETLRVELDQKGFHAVGRESNVERPWSAFQSAHRFDDGLLLHEPGVVRWLPWDTLAQGTEEEVKALVRSHAPRYERS